MGEAAEMLLDGMMCESCGEFIGEPVGYPRSCCDEDHPNYLAEMDDDNENDDDDEEPSIEGIHDHVDSAIYWLEMAIEDIKALKIKGHIKELSWLIKRMEQFKEKLSEPLMICKTEDTDK